ncbi:MAG: hypothetical protein RR346_12415 [Bacteroidales bacterium]
MKSKWVAILGLMLLAVFPLSAQLKGDGPKTAIIQYDYIVGENSMELVQYSTDYGALICFKYDYMGSPFATIVTNDSVFEVSYGMQAYKAYPRPEEDINFNALTPEIIKKYNVESTGTIEFLGKNCTIYTTTFKDRDIKKITVWVYKGLELRRVTEYMDDQTTDLVATSLEENPEISPDTFKIPEGFQIYAE